MKKQDIFPNNYNRTYNNLQLKKKLNDLDTKEEKIYIFFLINKNT